MLAITSARAAPMAMELSRRFWPGAAPWASGGDGVAGGAVLAAAARPDVWEGAAGAVGVAAVVRAGVSGTELDEAAEEAAAGVDLGWTQVSSNSESYKVKPQIGDWISVVPCSPCRLRSPSLQSCTSRLSPHL